MKFRLTFCFWNPESKALESGIQLKESGIQVPLTKNQESLALAQEFKIVLDSLSWGDFLFLRDNK